MIWLYRAERGGFRVICRSVRGLCAESFEQVLKQGSRNEMDSARTLQGWVLLQSKGLTRVLSGTIVQKHQFFGSQLSL